MMEDLSVAFLLGAFFALFHFLLNLIRVSGRVWPSVWLGVALWLAYAIAVNGARFITISIGS